MIKFSVEISEDELRTAVQDHIKTIVLLKAKHWRTQAEIEKEVSVQWKDTVAEIVRSALLDVPALREKVLEKIERKLTAQLNSAMRIKNDNK